ncbi:NADH-ubiquinone oxidoreductase chain K [[Actinomadura] parvosata subsp. kistnae]|nr:NADH-quinone oxidoreductase subunit NuoK [Nonomuraea sp. ATCC 55076]SPL94519.1 NADH-ubiquinone oxidoreductase chain K [Actinomadura parvosata subsp. kistnae]
MHIVYPAVVSALLFSIGVYGVLARRNTILVLMSVELMLNAVNLNLVAFDVWLGDRLHSGQVLTLFVIVIAAAEVGLGLAIVLALFRNRRTVDIDHLRDLAEPPEEAPQTRPTRVRLQSTPEPAHPDHEHDGQGATVKRGGGPL